MIRPYKGKLPVVPATCFVDPSAQLIGEVELGEHASIWMNCVLRGDVNYIKIGANSNVQDCSVMHGLLHKWPTILGDNVTVGHSATLHGCTVEDECLIGMGAVVLNGARIGRGSIIAAGAVIAEGTIVEPYSLWAGVPGKFRKKTDNEGMQEVIRQYARNYLGYKEQYLLEMAQAAK